MICDLMDGPDAFIAIANDRNFEFSSLRRAKFSTLCMLYQLYNQEDNFAFYCNSCNNRMKAGYHCRVCNVSRRNLPHLPQSSLFPTISGL